MLQLIVRPGSDGFALQNIIGSNAMCICVVSLDGSTSQAISTHANMDPRDSPSLLSRVSFCPKASMAMCSRVVPLAK